MSETTTLWTLGLAAAGAALTVKLAHSVVHRLNLSAAKHPSLGGHSRMAKRVTKLLPGYAYNENEFFNSDGAPHPVAQQRRNALIRLGESLAQRCPKTLALTQEARQGLPDLQFTGAYRVPYQFSPLLRQHIQIGAFYQTAEGVMLTDLDGNRYHDLTGSYGVNVFGVDVYRQTTAQGVAMTQDLGPILAGLHPVVASNVERLKKISGLDQVSFHMSGTEAVMQAVRLARYHTRRKNLVRFNGAYHGWWEDVQPGPGNPMPPRETYTLADMSEQALKVLRTRKDIACVLVNPLQGLHPNKSAPGDSSLVDSSRSAGYDRSAYTAWLKKLRQVCTEAGIVLIFDEVFLGFRLAPGGAQEYFGVQADMVTYGKTLGGGLPVGVVCGKAHLMKRFREERPADICFARGTFNSHPYVMGAMSAFLDYLETPEAQSRYANLDATQNARCAKFNQLMAQAGAPVVASAMSSVWTLSYNQPSRYNWMLQFYLREQGLALSWVGTGRLIWSLNYSDADFEQVCQKFLAAAAQMTADGWWWRDEKLSNKAIKRRIFKEMLSHWR
jgi:glutamate-1-semialdehyde 2,1-aminomutase